MIFHDSTKSIFFSKHQNKAEFKNLDDSEVPSCDFPGLRTSTASDRKGAKIQHDISYFYQKNIFSKNQNKAEFKNLDDSEVLSNDF